MSRGDVALRVIFCVLLGAVGFMLLLQSTFAWRMLDHPVPTAHPASVVVSLVLALWLAALPLLARQRFLGAYLVSGFLLSGIGAYWWTRVPWDALVTRSDFHVGAAPTFADFAMVAAPAVLAIAAWATLVPGRTQARLLAAGIAPSEARQAGAAARLCGAGAFLAAVALAAAMWAAFAYGLPAVASSSISGLPALVAAGALVALASAAWGRRIRFVRRPSTRAAGRAGPAQSRERRWPS